MGLVKAEVTVDFVHDDTLAWTYTCRFKDRVFCRLFSRTYELSHFNMHHIVGQGLLP